MKYPTSIGNDERVHEITHSFLTAVSKWSAVKVNQSEYKFGVLISHGRSFLKQDDSLFETLVFNLAFDH